MASAVRSTRFGGDLQASQNSHLFATVIEGGLLARPRLHTPHSGREGRVLDIQFSISGELASVTARAHKVGTRHLHLAQGGEDRLGAHLPIVSLFSARARKAPLIGGGYRNCSNSLSAAAPARCRAERIAISTASRSSRPVLRRSWKITAQELVYFAPHFLADRFRRFFSWLERTALRRGASGRSPR